MKSFVATACLVAVAAGQSRSRYANSVFYHCDAIRPKDKPDAPYGGIRFSQKKDREVSFMMAYYYQVPPFGKYSLVNKVDGAKISEEIEDTEGYGQAMFD